MAVAESPSDVRSVPVGSVPIIAPDVDGVCRRLTAVVVRYCNPAVELVPGTAVRVVVGVRVADGVVVAVLVAVGAEPVLTM